MVRTSVSSLFSKPLAKHLAIGMSLANLWLLPFVSIVLGAGVDPRVSGFALNRTYYLSTLLALAIVGVISGLVIDGIERIDPTRRRVGRTIVLLGTLFVIFRKWRKYNLIRIPYFADYFAGHVSYALFVAIALTLFAVGAFVLVRYATLAGRGAELFILMFVPFLLFVVAQLVWRGARAAANLGWDHPATATRSARPPTHVVLVIFDELDRRAFGAYRMAGFKSPEMDRLANESFGADSAIAPALYTEAAIPSILTGKRVDYTMRSPNGDLLLWYRDSLGSLRRLEEPNLFTRLQSAGSNVGVVGWYHSYCSDLARDVSRCWTVAPVPLATPGIGLLRTTAAALSASYALDVASKRRFIRREADLLTHGTGIATDSTLALAFVHLAVPHGPFVQFYKGNGYFGNLTVVDAALGTIRNRLEQAGMWDASTIIVTGDHGVASARIGAPAPPGTENNRSADVPFLIKLPNQHKREVFSAPIGTEVLASLIPELLSGKLREPEALVTWLELHRCAAAGSLCTPPVGVGH